MRVTEGYILKLFLVIRLNVTKFVFGNRIIVEWKSPSDSCVNRNLHCILLTLMCQQDSNRKSEIHVIFCTTESKKYTAKACANIAVSVTDWLR